MKELKISLVVIVVMAIVAGIFLWIQRTNRPDDVKPAENPFIAEIVKNIEELKAKPDGRFCKDSYREIAYKIDVFHKEHRFSTERAANNQEKANLEKNLYAAYAEKFIKQAKTVFRGSEWNPEALRFIQAEKNELRSSGLLVAGSPVDNEFATIQKALNKYNEIVTFIESCKAYEYSGTDLSARFPVDDVKVMISRSRSLLGNHLENEFVNNCTRLNNELKEIPQTLFEKHVLYLDRKIDNWSEMYPNYNSQSDYSNLLYKPLKSEIEELDNDLYNVPEFDGQYNRLLQRWSADNTRAYEHKYH